MHRTSNHRLVLGAAVCALSLSAPAQDYLGFSYNTQVGAASRGSLGTGSGEVMTRIDGSDCAGWGTGVAGHRTIHSIACLVQDYDAATLETFSIRLYPEDPARPGWPDLNGAVLFAAGIPGPIGVGGAAELRLVAPATPVSVPIQGGGDVFVAFELGAAPAGDGLAIQVVLGFNPGPGFPIWDSPSALQGGTPVPAGSPSTSRFLSRNGATVLYNTRRQCWLDVAHQGAGGVGLAITNQTSFPSSNDPPPTGFGPSVGTGDFLSGSTPDIVGDNAGRADDVGMQFYKSGLGTGQLVAFLFDQDVSPAWGPELPVSMFFGGATGSTCLVQPLIVAFKTTTNGEASLTTTLPLPVRAQLLGLVGKQQAAAFDQNGVLHASACDAMRF